MFFQFVLITCLAGFALAGVPSFIHVCGRKNPKLDECVGNSVDSLREPLREGIPELNVPPIEPLILDEFIISNHSSFKAIAKNVRLVGFINFIIKHLHIDLEKKEINIDLFFDEIKLDATYDVAAKVVVPITGKGPINIVTEGVGAKVTLKYDLVDHKGGQRLFFTTMTTKLTIKDYTSQFVSQEGSDAALNEGINAALSQNRQEIIAIIIPSLEKSISRYVLTLANGVCKNIFYDELFPDRI